MHYVTAMKSVLQFDESVYPQIMASGKSVRYCLINILVLGVAHAFFSLYFGGALWSQEVPLAGKVFFILAGAGVAFLMHAGAALFLWVFTRGVGGRPEFVPVYFNAGVAGIGLWPLVPVLSAFQAGFRGQGVFALLTFASLYGLLVIFFAVKNASQLDTGRMVAAITVCIVVVGSLLYLWL